MEGVTLVRPSDTDGSPIFVFTSALEVLTHRKKLVSRMTFLSSRGRPPSNILKKAEKQ